MPLNEKNDPEMSYRRGYQDGASEMLRALEQFLDPATRQVARGWIFSVCLTVKPVGEPDAGNPHVRFISLLRSTVHEFPT
jgi:hypothetical protein